MLTRIRIAFLTLIFLSPSAFTFDVIKILRWGRDYPNDYDKPILELLFNVDNFKNITNTSGYVNVQANYQYSNIKLETRMVSQFPDHCSLFRNMMVNFYDNKNKVDSKYGDITLTFTGFSSDYLKTNQGKKIITDYHKIFYEEDGIKIVLTEKFFIKNNKLLSESFNFCKKDSLSRFLHTYMGLSGPDSPDSVYSDTLTRHEQIANPNRSPKEPTDNPNSPPDQQSSGSEIQKNL